MNDICGIYMMRNKINNKIYIGQSVHVNARLEGHKNKLNKHEHDNRHLQFAWDKYSESNFEFVILCECEENKLNELEQYYILCYESYLTDFGYNLTLGGKSCMMREETRRKIGEAVKGEKNGFFGKTHSEEQKAKWSKERSGENSPTYGRVGEKHPFYRKHHTEEAKQKMREALTGTHYQKEGEDNPNSKVIYCIELDRVFYGIKNAGRELGIAHQSISACVNKRRKSAGKDKNGRKLHWVYYEEYLKSLEQ